MIYPIEQQNDSNVQGNPEFNQSGFNLWQGDNLELLDKLPADFFDAIVTDMPYGSADPDGNKIQKHHTNDLMVFNFAWDQELPLAWIQKAARVLKPGGAFITFTDNRRAETIWNEFEAAGINPLQSIYWRKTNSLPQPRKNFRSAIETAVFGRKKGKIICWNGGGGTENFIEAPICCGPERTSHPTQKPEKVMRWLCSLVTDPGMTVLDPFMGAGTVVKVAYDLGLIATGIELDPGYFQLAKDRVEAARLQPANIFPRKPAPARKQSKLYSLDFDQEPDLDADQDNSDILQKAI